MPTNEPLQFCQLHRLHFDPCQHSVCVLCRRSITPTRSRKWHYLGLSLALAALALLTAEDMRQRTGKLLGSTSTDGSPGRGDSAIPSYSAGSAKLMGSPLLLRLLDDKRGCDGGTEKACLRFVATCKENSAYSSSPNNGNPPRGPLVDTCHAVDGILAARCRRGMVEACAELGLRNESWRRRACKLGNAESCAELHKHPELSAELQGAVNLANCQAGDPAKCLSLADEREAREPPDSQGAVELRREACKLGAREACDVLAERSKMEPRDATEACEAGQPEACQWLQHYYQRVPTADATSASDFGKRALAIFERRCASGDQDGCRSWGIRIMSAGGSEAARGQAVLDSACRASDELACWALGRMFSVAFGPPELQDRALSQRYYALGVALSEASCARHDAAACARAALAHGAGMGVPFDGPKADAYRLRSIEMEKAQPPQ